MSILITGIDMPKKCLDCPCCSISDDNKAKFCAAYDCKQIMASSDRPDWCPLRPMPKKHGDLIDREDFIKVAFAKWVLDKLSGEEYALVRDTLKNFPAVVGAED